MALICKNIKFSRIFLLIFLIFCDMNQRWKNFPEIFLENWREIHWKLQTFTKKSQNNRKKINVYGMYKQKVELFTSFQNLSSLISI